MSPLRSWACSTVPTRYLLGATANVHQTATRQERLDPRGEQLFYFGETLIAFSSMSESCR